MMNFLRRLESILNSRQGLVRSDNGAWLRGIAQQRAEQVMLLDQMRNPESTTIGVCVDKEEKRA